jgi:hypothetical protein
VRDDFLWFSVVHFEKSEIFNLQILVLGKLSETGCEYNLCAMALTSAVLCDESRFGSSELLEFKENKNYALKRAKNWSLAEFVEI